MLAASVSASDICTSTVPLKPEPPSVSFHSAAAPGGVSTGGSICFNTATTLTTWASNADMAGKPTKISSAATAIIWKIWTGLGKKLSLIALRVTTLLTNGVLTGRDAATAARADEGKTNTSS